MRIYLCGPINGCSDDECNDWRDLVKKHFPGMTIDPMRRDYRGKEREGFKELVELDKKDIEQSDIILANCPKPSVGTSMEIFYAWQLNKFIITVVPRVIESSPWLVYHSMFLVESMEEAIAKLNEQI